MTEEYYDLIFKMVIIGDSGVGKSNLFSRYMHNTFNLSSKTTIGVEFGAKKLHIQGRSVKAQIWDTAGQERYKSITSAYYKGAKGALLVFDLTSQESFDAIDKWLSDVKNEGDPQIIIILIGNKSDLIEDRQVKHEVARAKAENLGKQNMIKFHYLKG